MGDATADGPDTAEPDHEVERLRGGSAPGPELSGSELAHARRQAGLTQRELADRLGIRLWMIDQWEAGAKPIPHETLGLIGAAIGTPAAGPMPALRLAAQNPPTESLTAQEIREAPLPRSLRGYDEGATRRLLDEVASAYERSVHHCDELRRRAAEMEAARDELREHIDELARSAPSSTEMDALAAERDELRKRVDELAGELAEQERAATGEEDELRRRVAELEQTLAGYADSELTLSRALVAASRAGEELVKEAEAEAQTILDDARRSAEEIQREIDDRRESFDNERAAIVEQLKRDALASVRDDVAGLGRAAEPVFAALAAFEERVRAFAPSGAEETADAELLDDLKAAPAEKAAASGEANRG
jgi:cell division septum initiation protein DivIVA/DNA-binding transcriptional regulator YiaG